MLSIYQKDGISVFPVLDKRREYVNPDPKSDGCLYKIRIRVVFQRKSWEFGTGKMITERDWIKELETSKSPKLKEIRKDLQSSYELIKKHVQDLAEIGQFSFENLNNRLKARKGETLNDLFKAKVEEMEDEGREGSRLYYYYALKNIEKYKGERIPVASVNINWLKEFEKHLLAEGKTFTTVGMHMRAIRAIINAARSSGTVKVSVYPFGKGKYEIPSGKGRKLALSMNQIKKVMEYTNGNPRTEFYRDLWIFSYLCNGINFIDLIQLKFSDIHNGELEWYRQKTIRTTIEKTPITAYITPEVQAIIDRWGNPPNLGNFIFPILKGGETQKEIHEKARDLISATNRSLKKISENLGIVKVSTYTARHSFATVLKRSGANIAFISESLGHGDLKTTENYLASFEKEEREKAAKMLTNFSEEKHT